MTMPKLRPSRLRSGSDWFHDTGPDPWNWQAQPFTRNRDAHRHSSGAVDRRCHAEQRSIQAIRVQIRSHVRWNNLTQYAK